MERSTLYRVYESSIGYLVYRHCFDQEQCSMKAALEHKPALFVTRREADHYCDIRNRMVDENGDDRVPE